MVWNSSINSITFFAASTSFTTFLSLSSNSPRYFAPATILLKSTETSLFVFSGSGTSPDAIFCAKPSITAVLPTPGSPIRQGLFFVRLESICVTLSISFERPITGSNLPSFATCVKSLPNWSRVGVFELGFGLYSPPVPPP